MSVVFRNPRTGALPAALQTSAEPLAFHRRLPGYAPTPIVELPSLAERLGLDRLLVKDESHRFGLPSFKLLGASWATYRALADRVGHSLEPWKNIAELASKLVHLRPFALAAATDGNHGRAVARMAKLLGFEARIFVPEGTATARIRAIESEGASVSVVAGDYDDTIARSAEEQSESCLVIDDTAWSGYETIPRWVIEGYATIFVEIEEALEALPDVVFVPLGVGALGGAAVDYCKKRGSTRLVGVEPVSCASVLESVRAGRSVTVPGPHPSMMAGLNCGTPSPIALPSLIAGLDWCVAIEDSHAEEAMRSLAEQSIVSGETGAAALGGLLAMRVEGVSEILRGTSLVLVTEGATDPVNYERIVGRKPLASDR
jgi:diaminopropionate ammonia-lyase